MEMMVMSPSGRWWRRRRCLPRRRTSRLITGGRPRGCKSSTHNSVGDRLAGKVLRELFGRLTLVVGAEDGVGPGRRHS